MRHFRATYTQYCIKHSLEPVQSRDEIIRFLVNKYNLRSTRETVWRIRGVRWRQDSEPVAVAPTKPESGEEETSLWKFMNAKAVVTKDRRNHWLDMKNNRLPSGALQKGIRQRYMEWCEQKEEMPVESLHLDPLSDESEEKGLTAWALTNDCNYQEVEVQKILHCSLAPEPNLVLDCRQLIADFLEVLVDIVVLISPALLCCLNALGAQQVYAQTTVTETPVQMMDVLGTALPYIGYDSGGKQASDVGLSSPFGSLRHENFGNCQVLSNYVKLLERLWQPSGLIFDILHSRNAVRLHRLGYSPGASALRLSGEEDQEVVRLAFCGHPLLGGHWYCNLGWSYRILVYSCDHFVACEVSALRHSSDHLWSCGRHSLEGAERRCSGHAEEGLCDDRWEAAELLEDHRTRNSTAKASECADVRAPKVGSQTSPSEEKGG